MSAVATSSSTDRERARTFLVRAHAPSSNLTLLTSDAAHAVPPPHHRIFDAKHVDPQLLLLVLREWISADTSTTNTLAANHATTSLSLTDAPFFTSLYHNYHVRREFNIDLLCLTRKRRIDAITPATPNQPLHVPVSTHLHPITWFIPRFRIVKDRFEAWSAVSAQCPA